MTYGAPIVASDRGSIPEVAGDAALFVDAEDDAALADALAAGARRAGGEAERLRAAGARRVRRVHVAALGRADAGRAAPRPRASDHAAGAGR